MEFYRDNGPSVLAGVALVHPSNSFKMDGYMALMVGQNVPHNKPYNVPPAERDIWRKHCQALAEEARRGMGVKEALNAIRGPGVKMA